jgi:L-lactate dehydrogenase complex protein LldE
MKVGLFIPCYVNAVFPQVGVASYKLLDHLGVEVDYPIDQTCCGQPMANGGFEDKAIPLAKKFDQLFEKYDYVVAPSASCVAFVKENYPRLLKKEDHLCQTSGKIYDICEFLHDVLKVDRLPGKFPHKVSVHNSCHGVRELHLSSASELNIPKYSKVKDLLSLVEGVEVLEPQKVDECCGFGGMFSVEESAISSCMGEDKVKNHMATGAEYITGADSSCLMHMEGVVDRNKLPIKFIHVVEILAAGL